MIKIIPQLLLGMMFLASSCGGRQGSFVAQNNEKAKKLDSLFNYLYEHRLFNGAVAVVDRGDIIFRKGYGLANVEDNTPFDPHTSMEVASVSKQFTAAAMLHLEQEGKLSVNEDIRNYLPKGFPYEGVKIKHLLSHTGGLPDYTDYFVENWPVDQLANNKDILAYFLEFKPNPMFKPGTDYSYSNTGYVMLAEIVEAVSGQTLDEYLEENLFRPFGLKQAGFYQRSEIYDLEDYAPSFMWSKDSCAYIRPEYLPGKSFYYFLSDRLGPGRLSLSLEDLLHWDQLLYTNAFLEEEHKQAMFRPVDFEGVETDYGYGFHNYSDEEVGNVSYHTGSWAGNLSYIKRFRDIKSTVILLNNTHQSAYMKEIREAVDAITIGRDPAPILPDLKEKYGKLSCEPGFDLNTWLKGVDKDHYSYADRDLQEINQNHHQ
ncbi:serine hydrolase domain-containing protein [Echinicola shivajiensis]|uniref:serine hydrolase domain-containing protein n=1 Tax=Echinicola shivajiensis TaxID=1035916 RepID=UPI001BFC020F|nr:serine hydrolase domain-containing protein [Echinicola shivajiensis]